VVIELSTSIGERRLKLGPEYRVAHGPGLHAELDALLGDAILAGQRGPRTDASEPLEPDAAEGELRSRSAASTVAVH
jgi:hypothetical protein